MVYRPGKGKRGDDTGIKELEERIQVTESYLQTLLIAFTHQYNTDIIVSAISQNIFDLC